MKSASKSGIPTAASFPSFKKDLIYTGHNKLVQEQVPFQHMRSVYKQQNNAHAYKYQVQAKPAGCANLFVGSQIIPHSVP